VEFFLNIAWLVVSISLAFLWKKSLRGMSVHSRHPNKKAQLIALALLIVILLPVVSITDDMHAMPTAEIEHVTRRADLLPIADQPQHLIDILHARLLLTQSFTSLHTFAQLEPPVQGVKLLTGSIRQTANRPPPFAV
jgi:hypothetical protein